MLAWIAFNQFLLMFILYLRSNISGLLMFKTDSVVSVLDRLLMILFCSILLWGNVIEGKFKIEWFVYAQTAAYVITAIFAFSVVMVKASFTKVYWNWPFILMILKKSLPFAVLFMLMAQYNRIDTVLIERLLPEGIGAQQSGVYAQAFRLYDAANMIAFLFAVLLLPLFSRMIKLKQSVEDLVKLSFSILFTVSVIAALGSYFYSHEIMGWLYPRHSDELIAVYDLRIGESAYILGLLMFGFVAISMVYVFSTLLTANGSLKALNIIAASGVMISLVINFIMIPRMQAMGSAYASLAAQFSTAIAQVIVAIMLLKFRTNYRFLAVLVLYVGGVVLMGWISTQLPYDWKINISILIMGSGLMAIILRLLNIKQFIAILKSEKA
jgi:O-antigen/teichoic acid export membrane protein